VESFSTLTVGDEVVRTIAVTELHFEDARALFADDHPIHSSDEYARERGHPGRTVPGSMITGIASSSLAAMLADCGLALLELRTRFRAPAYLGDELTSRCVVKRKEPKPHRGGGLVFFEITLTNGDGTVVAIVEGVDLVADAPTADG
jgi:3-hydroxybutyryl-CoA dehydratase